MPELLITVIVAGIAMSIAWPSFAESRERAEVRYAGDEFISALNRVRAEAVRGTGLTQLHLDASNGRVWIESDTSWGGGAQTVKVGSTRDMTDRKVGMTASRSFICFNSQGLPTQANGCPPTDLTVVFTRGATVDTVSVTAAGKVYR